jgi:hypothetical protein
MKLIESLNQHEIVLAIAERIAAKHPSVYGKCAIIAKELLDELTRYGVVARHVLGQFKLDKPNAENYIMPDQFSGDDTSVDHGWITVEGKILDISAKQFRRDVEENIPDIVFIDHTDPLFLRYDELGQA